MTINDIAELVIQQIDIGEADWFAAELVPYINHAITEIVSLDKKAYPVAATLSLVAGPVQSVGTTYIELLDVVCNIVSTATIGRTVTFMPKQHMDSALPEWMTYTANATVRHVVRDEYDPGAFYVFPPQPSVSPGKLRVVVSQAPTVDDVTDAFPLDANYVPAVVDYTLYMALMDNRKIPDAKERAGGYLTKFYRDLGLQQPKAEQGN
jgi:hypothetical protein